MERLTTLRPEFSELVTRPFEEFLEWSPVDLDFLDYADFAERVVSAIPDVDLRLRPFLRSELAAGDVIQDFCATIGVDVDVSGSQSTNVGVGWRTTELAKRVTPLLGHAALGDRVSTPRTPPRRGCAPSP